ncbi:unnamed protein product [Symbiodinium necroappetens]|uniref:Uncharacterized protein n=1 Tax=Symbiodinium necroappetens TaxID=1628268 RepID=A0A813AUE0_9DINO|nr:unnamed protein product [Symbiodinium necroappetens]
MVAYLARQLQDLNVEAAAEHTTRAPWLCQLPFAWPAAGTYSHPGGMTTTMRRRDFEAGQVHDDFQQCLLRDGPEAQAATYSWELNQKRAVSLLLAGSVAGLLGFLCAGLLGIHNYYSGGFQQLWAHNKTFILENNFMGEPFPSGHNYCPQTVSELVHDHKSAEGKLFFGFGLLAAICILASWYPAHLRNVYLGDGVAVCGCCGPTWQNMRQFCPSIGLFLVTCIPTVPPANRHFGENFTVLLHTCGAIMMVGGYGLCEIVALQRACSRRKDTTGGPILKPGEWRLRAALIGLSLCSGVAFQVCGFLSPKTVDSLGTDSCADVWVVPSKIDFEYVLQKPGGDHLALAVRISQAIADKEKLLLDTAHGSCLLLKTLEYWFEVSAGLFMVGSHLAARAPVDPEIVSTRLSFAEIWWYCPERRLDLPEKLPELAKRERETGKRQLKTSDSALLTGAAPARLHHILHLLGHGLRP